jgi:hypothetical protein
MDHGPGPGRRHRGTPEGVGRRLMADDFPRDRPHLFIRAGSSRSSDPALPGTRRGAVIIADAAL